MKCIFKKLIAFISAVLIIVGMNSSVAFAATWSGLGTESSPYRISDESGLRQLATNVRNGNSYSGKYFLISSDIALKDAWTPIGTSSTAFRGTFDGNEKNLSGMTASGDYVGLFAYVGSGAAIKNVRLTDFSVEGKTYVAGLVAYANAGTGTIEISNCYVNGTVRENSYSSEYLAGIVGYANAENGKITISDCENDGTFVCSRNSGGIIGYGRCNSYSLKLINCINRAHISAGSNSNYCGGIAGSINDAELRGCINYGNVGGNAFSEDNGSSWLGGVAGWAADVLFDGCINYGNISTFFAGGISSAQSSNIAKNCLNAGKLTYSSDGYGVALIYSMGLMVNCYYYDGPQTSKATMVYNLTSGSVAYALGDHIGQKIGVDSAPCLRTEDNRVYKVTVIGEVNRDFYVNYGDTINFPELSSCTAYFDGDSKFDTSTAITRDYALTAKGYHKYVDGICTYCGNEGVFYKAVGSCGEAAVWSLSDSGTLTISGSGRMYDYSSQESVPWHAYASDIKSIMIDKYITNVGNYAFYGLSNVTDINLADTVTDIGDYAFYGLSGLTAYSIGNGVVRIGDYAFALCTALKNVELGEQIESIGNYAFYKCESLNHVSLPSNVITLGNGAFMNCSALDWFGLGSGVKSIGSYALSGTALDDVTIPSTVETIGNYVFKDCSALKTVTILGTAPAISEMAFYGNAVDCFTPDYDSSWDSVINKNYGGTLRWSIGRGTCGASVNWIVDYSGKLTIFGTGEMQEFDSSNVPWSSIKDHIVSAEICDGVTSVGSNAFRDCKNLTSVTIANSVTKIGSNSYRGGCSFVKCSSLTQITIPENVSFIADSTFLNCTALTSIDVASGNSTYSSVDGVLYDRYKNTLYCYPAGKVDTAFTIPASVKTIFDYAFSYCNNLKEITIPANVNSINENAFYYDNIDKITFVGSAPTIDSSAFWQTTADVYYPLEDSLWTPDKLINYGGDLTWHANTGTCGTGVQWKLIYKNGYATLTISGVGAIPDYSSAEKPWKAHSSYIRTLVVENGITHIGSYAFSSSGLTTVRLADSVKSIGVSAFGYCSNLYSVGLGNGLESIGESAFLSSGLSSVVFPDSLKSIGQKAFRYCKSLRSVTLGNGVKSVGDYAFSQCTAMNTLELGSSVTSLGSYAFEGCTALNAIDLGSSVSSLGAYAFSECSSLKKVVIPASVTRIDAYAFHNCTNLQYVEFLGNAPTVSLNSFVFSGVTCNAYYHSSKTGWGSLSFSLYGKTITWGEISEQGTCGSSAEWILDTAGNLLICGSGYMNSYSETSKAPWYDYRDSIKKITILGVTSIGSYAFSGCTSVATVIARNVSSVRNAAFAGCTQLQTVLFESSYPSFATDAFSGVTCEVWYPSTASGWASVTGKNYGGTITWRSVTAKGTCGLNALWALDSTGTLIVLGTGSMDEFSSIKSQPWYSNAANIKAVVIGDKITSIADYAFSSCTAIQTVTIGTGVTSIDSVAFSNCSALKSITFRGNAPTIYSNAFNQVTATVYYPVANATWTSSKRQNYGGTLTWEVFCVKHNETVAPAVAPTCTTDGLTEGLYCSLCNEVLVAQEKVPARGHYAIGPDNTEVPVDTLAGDCFNPIMCTVCNMVAKPAMGHRVLGVTLVETDPLEIDNTSSYPFSLTDGTYYSTNKSHGSSSLLTITALYDCTLTLNYGVSSEGSYDKLYISRNNSTLDTISGEVSGKTLTLTLAAGDTVQVRYSKDSSQSGGSDMGWVSLDYDWVTAEGIGDVPADTAEPTCTEDVVCRYCQTVVKEAAGHRVILQQQEPEKLYEIVNTSEAPFVLTDGIYYSSNHESSSASDLKVEALHDFTMTLNYGVSSETNYDKLIIILNGTTEQTISGLVTDKSIELKLTAGDVLIIRYQKDESVNQNDDRGWVSLQHKWEPAQTVVPADTIETDCDGVTCDFCQTVVKEGLGHAWDEGVEQVPATETSEGEMLHTCERCGETMIQPIPVLEHIHNYSGTVTPPGCEADGYTTYTCRCGDSYIDDYVPKTGHSYKSEITTPATHTAEGVETFTCDCGASYTEVIAKIEEHTYVATVTPSTCEENGYTTYTCACGDTYTEIILATGHDLEEISIPSTSCIDIGYECYKCTNCGKEYGKTFYEPLDHSAGEWQTEKAATCTQDGCRFKICTVCEIELEREVISATGHSYSVETLAEPTCIEDGLKRHTCSACGDSYDEAILAVGHISVTITTEPTCSSKGTIRYLCEACGEQLKETEEIPMLSHEYEETVISEPTCITDGEKRYTCSACGDSYSETIPSVGEHKTIAIRKEPTCTKIGTEQYVCEVCGNLVGDLVILPKLDHSYGEWTVVRDPTATEDGSKEHSCTVCGKAEAATIPAIGFETADGVTVDFKKNIISGFNSGETSLDGYTTIVKENYIWEYETSNGKLGTGSKAILKDGDTVIGEYTILVYGDTNGDSWYD
ncbi:MAG: leucine-rich repeat protein, partial [Clostridia bacterium]|nr:leucine-rich repeat protein [Clostridia bacterium]